MLPDKKWMCILIRLFCIRHQVNKKFSPFLLKILNFRKFKIFKRKKRKFFAKLRNKKKIRNKFSAFRLLGTTHISMKALHFFKLVYFATFFMLVNYACQKGGKKKVKKWCIKVFNNINNANYFILYYLGLDFCPHLSPVKIRV